MDNFLSQLEETKYLSSTNAWRYRAILRYFYAQHERLRHYLYPEEVFDYVKELKPFSEYTKEQLQQDLDQLTQWNNLIPRQETGRVYTIEDFKKNRYRYQPSPQTIEIERMIQSLEQLSESFGATLERSLFNRLLESLQKFTYENEKKNLAGLSNEELFSRWNELFDCYKNLTKNATDYLAHLKSEKAEEIMSTEAFLPFKDSLTDYLRKFVIALQHSSYKIETILRETPSSIIENIVQRLVEYQLNIPRFDEKPTREKLEERYLNQWNNLRRWFLGYGDRESELSYLQKETVETIRRITKLVQRIGERHHILRSRRNDYLHLAYLFNEFENINDAHHFFAAVFGAFNTRHIFAKERDTDDIYSEIWDITASKITVKPRIRNAIKRVDMSSIDDNLREKQETLIEYFKEKEAENKLIEDIIHDNKIRVSDLGVVNPFIRKVLLTWIGKCMTDKNRMGKTENGKKFQLVKADDSYVTLHCEDGNLKMPNFEFVFVEGK